MRKQRLVDNLRWINNTKHSILAVPRCGAVECLGVGVLDRDGPGLLAHTQYISLDRTKSEIRRTCLNLLQSLLCPKRTPLGYTADNPG